MSKMRLFYPGIREAVRGSRVALTGSEHQHLRANRLRPGDRVDLFDANGDYVVGKVVGSQKQSSEVEVVGEVLRATTRACAITLGVSFPSTGSRGDVLVEKATELGVAGFLPVISKFSVLVPKSEDNRFSRWQRLILEASKQCLAPVVPTLHEPITFANLLQNINKDYEWIAWGCMPADEQFKPKPVSVAVASLSTIPKAALLLIGPEGDFSLPEKQALVAANCVPVTLSSNRLRTETASLAIIAAVAENFRARGE